MLRIMLKNFKLLMRSRSSAIIIVLGPLLMIFLVGMAFNNSDQYQVNIGVHSGSYSDLSLTMVKGLEDKSFRVTRYHSAEECTEAIKNGIQHTCIIFSRDLDVGGERPSEINFTVDYSKVNLVWMILDAISTEISSTATSLTTDMTSILIEKLDRTRQEMVEDSKIILEMTSINKRLKDFAVSSRESAGSLDLRFDPARFPISEVDEMSALVDEYIGYLILHSASLISDVRGEVKSLDLNLTMKKPIFDALDESESRIVAVQSKLGSQTENLTAYARDISRNLGDVQNQMAAAGESMAKISGNLDEAKKLIDQDLSHILALKSSFDRIEKEIASIRVFNAEDIAMPVQTNILPVNTESTHLNNLFPSLIIMVIMFISILLSSTLVIMEKRSKAYFRNLMVPTNDVIFILSTFFTSLIIVLFQVILLSLAAQFYFRIDLLSNIGLTSFTLLLGMSVFILIGMMIGYVFSREEASTLASISVGSIMLFLSSVIIPIESMPQYIIRIVRFNPFVLSEGIFRKSVILGSSFSSQKPDLIILAAYAVLLFVLVYVMQLLIRKVYISGISSLVTIRKKPKK